MHNDIYFEEIWKQNNDLVQKYSIMYIINDVYRIPLVGTWIIVLNTYTRSST